MGFAQTNSSQEDEVRFVLNKREAEVVLHLETVNPRRPVPTELIEGFNPTTLLNGVAHEGVFSCARDRHGADAVACPL